nr:MAG TPA: hypothetical protein [Caudoviricetes sp.]
MKNKKRYKNILRFSKYIKYNKHIIVKLNNLRY